MTISSRCNIGSLYFGANRISGQVRRKGLDRNISRWGRASILLSCGEAQKARHRKQSLSHFPLSNILARDLWIEYHHIIYLLIAPIQDKLSHSEAFTLLLLKKSTAEPSAAFKQQPSRSIPTTMTQLTWLVTGCSSGFGEVFVRSILARGDRVIATARGDVARLAPLKKAGAAVHSLDVTASQADINAKVEEAIDIYDGIDVIVNNAGYIEAGIAEEVT